MASNQIVLNGLTELRQALLALPGELVDKGHAIVLERAEKARELIAANYARGKTGNLQRGVRVTTFQTRGADGGVIAIVRNRAPHAYLWEHGTGVLNDDHPSRPRQTRKGYNRGSTAPARQFIPVAIRERRTMRRELIALVSEAGFIVRDSL